VARKIIPKSNNYLRRRGENLFVMPRPYHGPVMPKPVYINGTGLKPNTRYLVMLDNQPGNKFEDVTPYAVPVGESIVNNPRPASGSGRRRWTYFKSDAEGRLSLRVRTYGTDGAHFATAASSALVNGRPQIAGMDFRGLWKNWYVRTPAEDRGRDKVKLVAFSSVKNPTSSARIKELKSDISSQTAVGGSYGYGTLPPVRPEDAVPPGIICDCTFGIPGGLEPETPVYTKARYYQTFYIDAAAVDGSDYCDLTDINLYFRRKPGQRSNKSGRRRPGVRIHLLNCQRDGTPILRGRYKNASVRASYDAVRVSSTASSATRFSFKSPVRVKTNAYYAIAVQEEDPGFIPWENKKGDLSLINGVRTERRSQGSSRGHKGQLFLHNGVARKGATVNRWIPKPELDIKFDVNIAEYRVNDVDVTLVNKPYEFLKVTNSDGTWAPGEFVYKDVPNESWGLTLVQGSKRIRGDANTDFVTAGLRSGQTIVVKDPADSEDVQVFTIDRVVSANNLLVDEYSTTSTTANAMITVVGEVEVYDDSFNSLRLTGSSVNHSGYSGNNSLLFESGDTIIGVETGSTATVDGYNEMGISVFRSSWNATLPSQFKPTTYYNLSYETTTPGEYVLSNKNKIFYMNAPNHVNDYEGVILSRSQEIVQSSSTIANNGGANEYKSGEILLSYEYKGANTKAYQCPTLSLDEIDIITHKWYINNDLTNEHLNEGNAATRHISKNLDMGPGTKAEDVRVIVNGYRPKNTDIAVYAKVINSEDPDVFENKQWTQLVKVAGADQYSLKENRFDYREFEFTWADYPATRETLDGVVDTSNGNNTITMSGANTSQVDALSSGDVIRIYSPLFESSYQLFSVASANGTTGVIELNEPVSNVSHQGEGFKIDTILAEESAFRNPDNYNICRYFNSSGQIYDTYNKIAIKIILLAQDRALVPKVDDFRVIAVSA